MKARLELGSAELCALLLAILQTQRRNTFGDSTRAELERARLAVERALSRACERRDRGHRIRHRPRYKSTAK